jgi:hypothetical protein
MKRMQRTAHGLFTLAITAALGFGATSVMAQKEARTCYNPPSCRIPGECNSWCLAQNTDGGICGPDGCCYCVIN